MATFPIQWRLPGLLLLFALTGCTTVKTFGLDRIGPDLPIEHGDEIDVYLTNNLAYRFEMRVGSLDTRGLYGTRLDDPGEAVSFRWDEIQRIETRTPNTAGNWAIGIILVLGIVAAGEGLADGLENLGDLFDDMFSDLFGSDD